MQRDIFVLIKYWYFFLLVVFWLVAVSIFLSRKYLASTRLNPLKIYVTPILFIVLGSEKMFLFKDIRLAITVFIITTIVFSFLGAHIALKKQVFTNRNNELRMVGGKYSILLMLINIITLVILTFHGYVNPQEYESLSYTLLYPFVNGFVKGLLIGQSVNMWWHLKRLV
ncbi:hypothetical protein JK167_12325 [Levilactobacillus brevis]|uniref:DUF1453 domain-containing protein n=1 Tax=Levilactobacillus brevis TaxID=1580 RepID=A0AA41ERL5_LEVBR|nr:hypothetical protein [Levilactobacillus brevis]MBS0948461.1 hypothetical protein [Levilactobacillus brevis]MBS1011606.1 hypothetical protein [Levilactobacillus brevis]